MLTTRQASLRNYMTGTPGRPAIEEQIISRMHLVKLGSTKRGQVYRAGIHQIREFQRYGER